MREGAAALRQPENASLEPSVLLFRLMGLWGDYQFKQSNEASLLSHLKHEVEAELVEGCDSSEFADIAILASQLAHKRGESIVVLMMEKFAACLERDWGEPNDAGFVEHVRTPEEERERQKMKGLTLKKLLALLTYTATLAGEELAFAADQGDALALAVIELTEK